VVTAVEFSPILANHGRAALGIEVTVARAWGLSDFTGHRFDAIVSQSLEHVPDPGLTLAKCRELLVPDGLLMLEVPNQFHALVDRLKMAVVGLIGDRAYRGFHRDLTFEFHLFFCTSARGGVDGSRDRFIPSAASPSRPPASSGIRCSRRT
jgi:SAM-dependent methyltransferase